MGILFWSRLSHSIIISYFSFSEAKESFSQIQKSFDVKQFSFFLSDIIPKILPYHLIPHLSCMLKYAFNIIPSVLMEQLMMILIFIVHTQIYTQIHILFMLTMNNFIHFADEVEKMKRDRKKGWTSLKGFSAFHPFSF